MTRLLPMTAAAALIAAALSAPAFAAGSDSTSPPKSTKTSTECEKGKVYDEKTKTCLDAKSEGITDDDRYNGARELAYAGRYDSALMVLASAENQDDPRILNYMGFTNRKLGRTELAMAYYHRALELDPDYILARSYMGQGLAAQGDLAGAVEQLHEISLRGGRDTWAYASLKNAIGGVQTSY